MHATSRKQAGLAIVLATAAIGALGTIKTLLEVASGEQFSIQLIAFWIGALAILVYIALVITAIAAGLIIGGVTYLNNNQEPSDRVSTSIVVVCGALGIILAAYVAFQGVIFDYKGTDGTGRAFFGILGLSVLAVGIWGWRRLTQSPDADT